MKDLTGVHLFVCVLDSGCYVTCCECGKDVVGKYVMRIDAKWADTDTLCLECGCLEVSQVTE